MRILVSGISGLGGHLTPYLLEQGHDVVGLSRDPSRVSNEIKVPVLRGDVAENTGLDRAFQHVDVAYFLIHTYEQSNEEGFAARDRQVAINFAKAAERAGVQRIVYLGVPAPAGNARPSAHVESRLEVERILMTVGPQSVALRVFAIVSPVSRSFRVILQLVRSQPVLILPPWRNFRTQPIDVRDLLQCLAAAATSEAAAGQQLELAGPDVRTWKQVMQAIARELGVRRPTLPLPFDLRPSVAKIMASTNGGNPALVVPLMKSLACGEMLVSDNAASRLGVKLRSFDEAVRFGCEQLRTGSWKRFEGSPLEPVRELG